MPNVTGNWGSELCGLLEKQEVLCKHICDNSRILRDLLIKRDFTQISQEIGEIQKMNIALNDQAKKMAQVTHEMGLSDSVDEFRLSRLMNHERVINLPYLRQAVVRAAKAVQATGREAELNRRVFSRLADWNQQAARIIMAPLSDSAGYGAKGVAKHAAPRPALLDRRG